MGTVEAVAEGVDAAMVGKRVAVTGVHGAWAEFFSRLPRMAFYPCLRLSLIRLVPS
ncbi:hypothetical protein [Sulfitobacter brevis]|uniref:hypothetical protein n=1 Tax=Sulfitobacter brevis TaxID=74348 RepID=UPI003CCBDEE6